MYWLNEALLGLLPVLWMSIGLGLPWALALLSVEQWRSRALVLALALALGPAWMSAWMLLLGVIGAQLDILLLKTGWIIGGSLAIAIVGSGLAWRKRKAYLPSAAPSLAVDEKLIVTMIVVAVALRTIHTAFWPFTWYDSLWVYGYQGRLYFLEGIIPKAIDYYPPFLQLQYAYVQIVIGAINDHAARMVLPLLHIGSILSAYLLGERLVNRRTGVLLAGLWSLHPFVGQWSFVGDLEIPLTFSFTLAAVFFLVAWREQDNAATQRRNALLAGVLLGIALFTKPTAGAFVWGVLLLLAFELARVRFDWRRWMPRFTVAFWTGLACIPLGGAWYLRNILLGHKAITWPDAFWLTQARRSGDYLSWLALAVIVSFVALALEKRLKGGQLRLGLLGCLLILAAMLASNPALFPGRYDPPASYVRPAEALVLLAGLALVAKITRFRLRKDVLDAQALAPALWALLLATPYFLTFFFSYSYHYRLGFAIVPLLALPTAMGLSQMLSQDRLLSWRPRWRRLYLLILLALGIPGVITVAVDLRWTRVWLLDRELDNDTRKYQVFNPSLMEVVSGLQQFTRESDAPPRILAPGEERLHFFFPQLPIIDRQVETLEEFEGLGASHFIFGAKARQSYLDVGIDPRWTQLTASLGRRDLFDLTHWHYDGTYSYELYESDWLPARRRQLDRSYVSEIYSEAIVFGDALRLHAEDTYPERFHGDAPITLRWVWQALRPLDADYRFVLELFNEENGRVETRWILAPAANRHGHYSTLLWDVDELVYDEHVFNLPIDIAIPEGNHFLFRVTVLDSATNEHLNVSVDGRAAGDYWQLAGRHSFRY